MFNNVMSRHDSSLFAYVFPGTTHSGPLSLLFPTVITLPNLSSSFFFVNGVIMWV